MTADGATMPPLAEYVGVDPCLRSLDELVSVLTRLQDLVSDTSDGSVWILPDGDTMSNTDEVHLANGAVIRPFTCMVGPVAVFSRAIIGPFAFVRSGSAIGPEARVGHAAEIKQSIIGARTSVAHRAYVGHSYIGPDCMLGSGFTTAVRLESVRDITVRDLVNNIVIGTVDAPKLGAIMGSGVWLGCHTVTMPGTYIPSGSVLHPFNSYGGSRGTVRR